MLLIALTGGIASGKSTVAARFAELGAVVIDADRLAREVVEPGTPGLAAIAEHFGPGILTADGSLNRPALGLIIFSSAEQRAALNAITHPAVGKLSRERFAEAAIAHPDAIVIYDVPLLVEASGERSKEFDRVIVVHADSDVRADRLVRFRGASPEEARDRVAAQASDAARLAVADDVIDSNGTVQETLDQVDALWARLRA
jgi:dephospho-CoA kinase